MFVAFRKSYHFSSDLISSASPHQFQELPFREEISGGIHVFYCAGN